MHNFILTTLFFTSSISMAKPGESVLQRNSIPLDNATKACSFGISAEDNHAPCSKADDQSNKKEGPLVKWNLCVSTLNTTDSKKRDKACGKKIKATIEDIFYHVGWAHDQVLDSDEYKEVVLFDELIKMSKSKDLAKEIQTIHKDLDPKDPTSIFLTKIIVKSLVQETLEDPAVIEWTKDEFADLSLNCSVTDQDSCSSWDWCTKEIIVSKSAVKYTKKFKKDGTTKAKALSADLFDGATAGDELFAAWDGSEHWLSLKLDEEYYDTHKDTQFSDPVKMLGSFTLEQDLELPVKCEVQGLLN